MGIQVSPVIIIIRQTCQDNQELVDDTGINGYSVGTTVKTTIRNSGDWITRIIQRAPGIICL